MFMTLKYGRGEEGGIKHVDTSSTFIRSREHYSGIACTACRSKKLGCSREKAGCRRCQSRGDRCTYEPQKLRARRSQKHSTPPADKSSGDSPSDTSIKASSLQKPIMSSGDQSPLVMPEVCDQGISTNIAPPDLSEATAGPVNIMPDNYSPGSHPSLLNDECMPEFMDFHDDLFISGFSSSETSSSGNPDANESDFNPSYEPDARFLVNSSIFESDGHGCDVLGSPMDLVSPVPAPPGTSHSSISPELVPVNEEENCDCTGTALRMLELIATPPTRDDWQATEKKLYFLKKVISQCVVLSQCSSCPEDSGLSMLLIVMFEKLQTLFEEVADWRRRNVDHHGVLDSRQSPPSREARSYSSQDRGSPYQKPAAKPRSNLSMGCYQIDTPEEHLNIISTLVLLQLRRLAALVSKMRRNATKCRWDAHLNVLKSLTQRMKRLSATLQICHNLRGSDGRAKFMFC